MSPLKPPYNRLHFINYFTKFLYFLRYRAISTSIPHIFHISKFKLFDLKNPKLKVPEILPSTLSPTQIEPKEPKRSKIDPHFDYDTGADTLLEDSACR